MSETTPEPGDVEDKGLHDDGAPPVTEVSPDAPEPVAPDTEPAEDGSVNDDEPDGDQDEQGQQDQEEQVAEPPAHPAPYDPQSQAVHSHTPPGKVNPDGSSWT